MLTFHIEKNVFDFIIPAGTSRGVLNHKSSWFVKVYKPKDPIPGLGECSVIPGLSPDFISDEDYEKRILKLCKILSDFEFDDLLWCFENQFDDQFLESFFQENPSIRFGFEIALLDLKNGSRGIYFRNDFVNGKIRIPINGLIWMGNEDFMKSQINDKLKMGFTTLKMKVGAIDFNTEIGILKFIRQEYNSENITLRVDANGAFNNGNVYEKLLALSELNIHSIEQPIMPGNIELMKNLCLDRIVPIALDEELIGVHEFAQKISLLTILKPQYIILKPSLHGGIKGSKEWITVAEQLGISWWITSALESNVGLSALCQFVAEYKTSLPQGLGTGSLYSNNRDSHLHVSEGYIMNGHF